MLNDQGGCGMEPGIAYLVMLNSIVTCTQVLFPPANIVREAALWPSINVSNIKFDFLSKLKAMFLQKDVALALAKETFDLQVAKSSSEIQTALHTNFPLHFGELVHRIFKMSDMKGIVHFFKCISSGLVNTFQTIFGVIPSFIHSVLGSFFGGLPLVLLLVVGILILFYLLRIGCPSSTRNGNSTASAALP